MACYRPKSLVVSLDHNTIILYAFLCCGYYQELMSWQRSVQLPGVCMGAIEIQIHFEKTSINGKY